VAVLLGKRGGDTDTVLARLEKDAAPVAIRISLSPGSGSSKAGRLLHTHPSILCKVHSRGILQHPYLPGKTVVVSRAVVWASQASIQTRSGRCTSSETGPNKDSMSQRMDDAEAELIQKALFMNRSTNAIASTDPLPFLPETTSARWCQIYGTRSD
jgi:hypothetical protein